jgi:glycosyltransferase involved in cell wall biosynthesis
MISDLKDPSLCVARAHPGNTSRKQLGGICWQSRPVEDVRSLLGADWSAFVSPATAPATHQPLVSCIMPTCNRRSFLPLALQSFARQEYPRRELVVVDDGAKAVADLLEGVELTRYERISSRLSIGEKRNRACALAQGEIIAHWDDDDWYGPQRLSQQVAPLLACEADLTGLDTSCSLELPAGRFWRLGAELHRRMFVGNVHGGTLVYWKQLFDSGLRYPDVNLAEDAGFIRAALRQGKRLVRLPNEELFVYVRHGHNAWRFEAGNFLDSGGWLLRSAPPAFDKNTLAAYRRACNAMA